MKTFGKILFVLCLAFAPCMSQGQEARFQIGVEGGPSLTAIRYDRFFFPSKYCAIGMAGSFGVSVQYNANSWLAIKAGMSDEVKGYQFGKHFECFHYLVFPVMVKFMPGKKHRFFINAGPYVGYLLSQRDDIYFGVDRDEIYEYHRFDMGLSTGLGYDIPIGRWFAVTTEIRSNMGLYNIEKDEDYYNHFGSVTHYEGSEYTYSLVLQVGCVYKFGRSRSIQSP